MEEIRKRRVKKVNDNTVSLVKFPSLGNERIPHFLTRHPELQTMIGRTIEVARVKNTTPEKLQK